MAKEIKQKIVLSGEQEYNRALKDAQRNLKTLQTALKAETAELGKNASEQDKARVKAESLRKQIAEQEKVVKTLQEALAKAREEYGDNEAEIARWEQRLNNARTTLAGMKNDLGGVGEGMQKISTDAAAATVATKSVADALGEISGAGDAVAGAIEGIFQGMIETVSGALSELWGMISSTAAKANNWTDVSRFWGTDAQTIQEYARATQAQGKSFEELQNIVSKLSLGGKGKKITELIGVSDVNYQNQWDYAMAVMDQMNRMRESGANMDSIYEEIFGEKKSVKLMDMLNSWSAIQEDIRKGTYNGNETGYGMSDEELESMDSLWVKINEIEAKWEGLKDNFAAGFGVKTFDLLVNVEGTMDGLAAYMNATDDGEKQAALEQIRKNIEEFFRKVAEIIRESLEILRGVGEDLQKSDDPLTKMIGNILTQVADALQWFVDNQAAVKDAFNAIFGVWMLAKLGAVAGKLSEILLQIEAIKAFKGVSLGAAGAAGGAATTVAKSVGGGVLGGLASKVSGLLSNFGGGWFGANNLGVVGDWFTHNTHLGRALSGNESWLDVANAGYNYVESVKENKDTFLDDWKGVFSEMIDAILGDYKNREPEKEEPYILTEAQRRAAEKYYDTLRAGGEPEELFELTSAMHELFEDQDTLSRLLNRTLTTDWAAEDLPEEWFGETIKEQLTDEERMQRALAAENEANARAAQAEAEARERNRNLAEEQLTDEERMQRALAAESEANARAAQAEAEARERNRNPAEELLSTVTEAQKEAVEEYYDALKSGERDEDLWERTGALRELFGNEQDTLDRLMRMAPERDREAEPETTDALEEAAEKLEEVGRVLGGVVIAEVEPEEETIEETLDDLGEMQRQALEDLFDAWRETEGEDPGEEEFAEFDRMWDYAKGIFGDAFGDVLDQLVQKMDEDPNWMKNDDIPPDWLSVLSSGTWNQRQNGATNENGITRQDLAGFNALPGNIRQAVENGARKGVSGIQVNLDGYRVGQLIAPYVSEMIAREFMV